GGEGYEGPVEKQREQVGPREGAGSEERERDHREATSCFDGGESEQGHSSPSERPPHSGVRPSKARRFDEPVDDPAQPKRPESGAHPVEPSRRLPIPALRDPPEEQPEHGHGDG